MIREIDNVNNNPFARKLEYVSDNDVIGYLEYSLIYDRIEIDNFLVIDEYRGSGVGSKLLSFLVDLAKKYNAINITLEVRVSNNIAIHLYKKFGFREVALRKYYYGDEDGILMEMQVI